MQPEAGTGLAELGSEVTAIAVNEASTACPAESRDVWVPKDLMPEATEVLSLGASPRVIDLYSA